MINQLALIIYRQEHPEALLSDIGRAFHCTKERVRQILNQYNLPTRHISKFPLSQICPVCGGIKSEGAKRCKACWHQQTHSTYTCEECGATFVRKTTQASRNRHHYCNKRCYGSWFGKHHGGKRRKE